MEVLQSSLRPIVDGPTRQIGLEYVPVCLYNVLVLHLFLIPILDFHIPVLQCLATILQHQSLIQLFSNLIILLISPTNLISRRICAGANTLSLILVFHLFLIPILDLHILVLQCLATILQHQSLIQFLDTNVLARRF